MLIIGYILGMFVGVVLGLFGAGGAIISFPILVYFMGIVPQQASVYSLLIVGVAALSGVLKYLKDKEVDFKTALIFTPPVLLAFYITKQIIIPSIPEQIFNVGNFIYTRDRLLMTIFVITLSCTIYKMISSAKTDNSSTVQENKFNGSDIIKYLSYSFAVGILSASIGAGGGFIIVPALILLFRLPIKIATGTSLFVITANALVGTIINRNIIQSEHFLMITLFILFAIIGIFIGSYLNKILQANQLKYYYSYFLIFVLLSTIITETYKSINN